MIISLFFSVVIYRNASNELERVARLQRFSYEQRYESLFYNSSQILIEDDLIEEARHRIFLSLVIINLSIFMFSSGLGYFLAGKTLKPIAIMIEEQNRFVSDASHELKTPLTSLKSAFEVNLRDKKFDIKQAKELVAESIQEVDKLQILSENLLRSSQYHKLQSNFKLEKVSLSGIVEEAIAKIRPIYKNKNIILLNKTDNILLLGNRFSLVELFVILLDNACKYSPNNSRVLIKNFKKARRTIIFVEDNGIGIEKKDLPHIFERFYRADSARSKSGAGGYGLGLSIAKKIINHHNGAIEVKSIIKKGTTVKVVLPLFS